MKSEDFIQLRSLLGTYVTAPLFTVIFSLTFYFPVLRTIDFLRWGL